MVMRGAAIAVIRTGSSFSRDPSFSPRPNGSRGWRDPLGRGRSILMRVPLMPTFVQRAPMPASAQELYDWHARRGAFLRLQPPWERYKMFPQHGSFGTDGMRVTFRTHCLGPFNKTWVVEVFDFEPGEGFKYRQIAGPFTEWVHTFRFIPD